MNEMRIASLVPAATESLFALGVGEKVVAVSHECDYPTDVKQRPRLTRSVLDTAAMSSGDIDREIAERVRAGLPLYEVDAAVLADAQPDLIVTQSLCDVCALPARSVYASLEKLSVRPTLVSLEQRTLAGVLDDIVTLGNAVGVSDRARTFVEALRRRLEAVRTAVAARRRVRVVCLEWIDPPYTCGHWIPEMVTLAGAIDPLARPGTPSVSSTWSEVGRADPQVIVVFPCGHNRARACADLTAAAAADPDAAALLRRSPVFVAEAVLFTRPGPRVVDGVEALAAALRGDTSPYIDRWS
jgi:iron complex transport system substrate-binding protein